MIVSILIIEFLLMALLFALPGIEKKNASNKWRILYAAPTFVVLIYVILNGHNSYHILLYLAAFLQIVCLFLERVKTKRIMAGISAFMLMATLVIVSMAKGYNRMFYYDDFIEAFDTMKEHYVLTDEKGIDWKALEAKYKPLFKETDRTQDHVLNYKNWQRFVNEFFDGHVSYQMSSDNLFQDAIIRSYGNDYGLSLVRLSSGEYVAVNVEGYDNSYSIDSNDEEQMDFHKIKRYFRPDLTENDRLTLKNAGIKNGTVVTKWNGKPVDELFGGIDYYLYGYPVRDNEDFYKPIYASGIGKDMGYGTTFVPDEECESLSGKEIKDNPSVDITFIDDEGKEVNVNAPSLGAYAPRMVDTMDKIDRGENVTNLTWKKLNSDTYMLRIREMAYDQNTYNGTDYSEMQTKLREEIEALKAEGIKNIVFDLRDNSGGSPYFVNAIAAFFSPEGEHITYYNAVINEKTASFERDADGKYIMGEPISYQGENLWPDVNITLLVNAMCVSAGDDMTYVMGSLPNVKITGFTRTNSSCQAVTGVDMEMGSISFSAVPTLTPDGEIALDTFADHVSRTPFDEYIPFDENAVDAIFNKGEDYLIDYVVKEFE